MNDQELHILIECCKHNDRLAQEELYTFFYADTFRTCNRYTEQAHDALTILNDAFLKVFRNISQYRAEMGSFKSWLKTIVINTAIDYTRRSKKEMRLIHIDQVDEPSNYDFQLTYNWNHEELLQHLSLLPPVTRVVMNLFAFDGYSHKDIAEELDITESTSRWHLAEARKKLRNSLHLKPIQMAKYD